MATFLFIAMLLQAVVGAEVRRRFKIRRLVGNGNGHVLPLCVDRLRVTRPVSTNVPASIFPCVPYMICHGIKARVIMRALPLFRAGVSRWQESFRQARIVNRQEGINEASRALRLRFVVRARESRRVRE